MHDCVVKLLKNHDEESLECLCRLLTTIGKDLDFEKAKVKAPHPRILQHGLSGIKEPRLSMEVLHPAPATEAVEFSLLPFSSAEFGHHAPYHISIRVKNGVDPKLYKSQSVSCSDYLSLVLFLHGRHRSYICICKLWEEISGEKLLWARTEGDTETKKTQSPS